MKKNKFSELPKVTIVEKGYFPESMQEKKPKLKGDVIPINNNNRVVNIKR